MSDLKGPAPVTALNGASFDGYVRIAEAPLRGMITLRGESTATLARSAVTQLTGCEMPERSKVSLQPDNGVAWMSPDEILVMLPADAAPSAVTRLEEALSSGHYSAFDVSHARSIFTITGDDLLVREVIAKLAPVDMHPQVFHPGDFRRTRLAQVAAAFWMVEPGHIELVCFRSVAEYVFTLLCDAARADGRVGLYA